jgi:hypothetical protein
MCPTCIANVAVMVFGLTSIGGLTAFTLERNPSGNEETERQDKNLLDQKEENYG